MTYDHDTFEQKLLPAIKQIIFSYQNGTRFGIHADEDGLITGGDYQTQLTWINLALWTTIPGVVPLSVARSGSQLLRLEDTQVRA
jgi:hypothetical protein